MQIKDRVAKETTALIDEDYGFRFWVWFPCTTVAELEEWWNKLGTVNAYFLNAQWLPGEVFEVNRNDWHEFKRDFSNVYTVLLHNDADSYLETPSGLRLNHAGKRDEY